MIGEIGDKGYLRIANAEDRLTVASILFANGYSVSIKRKKAGKSFEYYVYYEIQSKEVQDDD